jgi:hypothetical protein
MKLIRYPYAVDVPHSCSCMWSVHTFGNIFSDEKSVCAMIEQAIHDKFDCRSVAVRVRDLRGHTMCVYVVDVS